jgi:hypothetical protein
MSRSIHSIARHFLNKDSLEQCTVEEIQDLAGSHPYASPIQFLLLEKLRTIDPEAYQAQVQKSILYFHDPVAFQYLLDPGRFITQFPEEETAVSPHNIPDEEIVADEGIADDSKLINLENRFDMDSGSAPIPGENVIEMADPEQVNQPELTIKPIHIPASGASDNELVFDPYHTVDYFASQGIKLSQEEFSKDKFGKQLKSFTEWLKSMKKLPGNEVAATVDSRTEDKVQHLAEDSIHQSEVYTEAMADVWIKQGNKAKAIEVYNKLSLLNPSKKAYFATQIENLKQS